MKPSINPVIEVFTAISQQLGPHYLAYWALPNTVLTLAGARAYCDGVFWNTDDDPLEQWREEVTTSMNVVKEHIAATYADVDIEQLQSPRRKFVRFDLITKDGLEYALTHSNLLGNTPIPFDKLKAQTLAQVCHTLVTILRSQPRYNDYSQENLNDIAFGIVLGYPDEAILETVPIWGRDDPFAEPIIAADIRGADYYKCPQPVYDYPRHLTSNPAIIDHEKTWSDLLRDYYQSDFHRALEKDENFQRKMRDLGNLR